MKKILTILLICICFLVMACAPSLKENAQTINKTYYNPLETIMLKDFPADLKKVPTNIPDTERLKQASILAQKYKSKVLELKTKLDKEQANDSNVKLLKSLDRLYDASISYLDILANPPVNTDYSSEIDNRRNDIFNKAYEYRNERMLITDNKSGYAITADNFRKIHKGDDYVTVVSYFKAPGTQILYYDSSFGVSSLYKWQHENISIQIWFENNKVTKMDYTKI